MDFLSLKKIIIEVSAGVYFFLISPVQNTLLAVGFFLFFILFLNFFCILKGGEMGFFEKIKKISSEVSSFFKKILIYNIVVISGYLIDRYLVDFGGDFSQKTFCFLIFLKEFEKFSNTLMCFGFEIKKFFVGKF